MAKYAPDWSKVNRFIYKTFGSEKQTKITNRHFLVANSECFHILQLSKIPNLHFSIFSTSSKIISIFRKRNCSNDALMSREVGDIDLLFNVPDFYDRVSSTGSEDKPVLNFVVIFFHLPNATQPTGWNCVQQIPMSSSADLTCEKTQFGWQFEN